MPLDKPKAPFSLPKLPYDENALDPVVSAKTISFHYGKHHKAYVDNLNKLVVGTPYEQMDLEEIVKKSAGNDKDKGIFNNAGQIWNHNFYWESMAPKGGTPAGKIADALKSSFGGVDGIQRGLRQGGGGAVRQRLGLAGQGQGRQAQDRHDLATPTRRSRTARRRCWPPTCGSTPTTSTTRIAGRTTSRTGWRSSRTGRSPRRTSARPTRRLRMLGTILLIILILILIGALPTWPYSSGWGYYPSGGIGLILIIVIVLLLMGRI